MAEAPRVFLSYSHDSDEHAARVLALADALSRDGCTVLFDQYVFPAPPDGWTAWMRQCLDPANSDFVLLICTEGYLRRFEGREEPGAGRGVRREGRLIDSRLYEQDAQAARYIPILLDPADLRFVPRELFDHNRYVLGAFHIQDPGYEALYRHLTGQPATPAPQPGEVIILPPKPRPRPSPSPPSSGSPMTNVPGATSPVSSGLDDWIRAVLRPLMATEQSRQARLSRVFHAYPGLLDRVATGGETGVFLSHLLQTLRDYGEVEPGRPAVCVLLESIKGEVGVSDWERIEEILAHPR